ncbi:MAG: hypothetical protein CXZ00_03775 [Acidobacteria bacterium]|nr:MAG: hypothetical protein CXZ00_03775 [Acidobacteriota bacterium]
MSRDFCFRLRTLFPVGNLLLMLLLLATTARAATTDPKELLNNGQVDEVLRLVAPRATGNNAAAFNYLGRAYYELGDWDNAVRNCERATQIAPNNAEFQLWLARSYGEKANAARPISAYSLARKSVAAFTAARNLDRHNLAIARDLGEYYSTAPSMVGGGSDKALALAAEMASEYPSAAAWLRAMVAAHNGNDTEAEREYNESIRLDRYSASTYIELARFLRKNKKWDYFQQTIERAIKSSRIRPVDRFDAAELLIRANRALPVAAQLLRAYIQSGHTEESAPLFRAHFLLGEVLMKTGDSAQAASEYRAALALASSYRPAADALRRLERR